MFVILAILYTSAVAQRQPAENQLDTFRRTHPNPVGYVTTSTGAPVLLPDAISTLNTTLTSNDYFMDLIAHFTRERIPERVVHAKGGGAFGYFEVTNDISNISKAKLFSKVGKKTPVAARFSYLVESRGSPDTSRDARGFSIKFYTEEGNFDMVGLSYPIFPVKDPALFPPFVHSQKKNPTTNLIDADAVWDFLTSRPESFYVLLYQFGDYGIPYSYSNMRGFGVHTFQVENERGDLYFIRFYYEPDSGFKFLSSKEARDIAVNDPDYFTRNLYNSISNGDFPSWTVSLQILSMEDVNIAGRSNVFDPTKTLSVIKYPLTKVGKLVLNQNPLNYFADIEQLSFIPGNLVPGILGSPDTLFQGRRIAYREAANYRLGSNFNNIPVNCPFNTERLTYYRDGRPPVNDNYKDIPNYFPNSFNGPIPYYNSTRTPLIEVTGEDSNNFEQAADFYTSMTNDEKSRLVENIVPSLGAASRFLQDRAVTILKEIHPDLGNRVQQGLLAN